MKINFKIHFHSHLQIPPRCGRCRPQWNSRTYWGAGAGWRSHHPHPAPWHPPVTGHITQSTFQTRRPHQRAHDGAVGPPPAPTLPPPSRSWPSARRQPRNQPTTTAKFRGQRWSTQSRDGASHSPPPFVSTTPLPTYSYFSIYSVYWSMIRRDSSWRGNTVTWQCSGWQFKFSLPGRKSFKGPTDSFCPPSSTVLSHVLHLFCSFFFFTHVCLSYYCVSVHPCVKMIGFSVRSRSQSLRTNSPGPWM